MPCTDASSEVPIECEVACSQPPGLKADAKEWGMLVYIWGEDCATWHQRCVDALKATAK